MAGSLAHISNQQDEYQGWDLNVVFRAPAALPHEGIWVGWGRQRNREEGQRPSSLGRCGCLAAVTLWGTVFPLPAHLHLLLLSSGFLDSSSGVPEGLRVQPC